MNTKSEVHFPAGTEYSCGDALFKPNSTDPAQVTCPICLSERLWRMPKRAEIDWTQVGAN
jgi:hypothetical protein